MANLAAKVIHETQPRGGRHAFPIANTVTAYEGMLVGIDATTGFAEHWADGASDTFAGICIGGHDRAGDGVLTGATADTPDPELYVDCSGVTLMHLDSISAVASQAVCGDLVYCPTSNTDDMTTSSSGRTHPIGWISRWRSTTDVDVTLFTPEEMLAQANA